MPCGLYGNLPYYKVPVGFYNNTVCCLRQKRLCRPHRQCLLQKQVMFATCPFVPRSLSWDPFRLWYDSELSIF